jgi:hypothetical protein
VPRCPSAATRTASCRPLHRGQLAGHIDWTGATPSLAVRQHSSTFSVPAAVGRRSPSDHACVTKRKANMLQCFRLSVATFSAVRSCNRATQAAKVFGVLVDGHKRPPLTCKRHGDASGAYDSAAWLAPPLDGTPALSPRTLQACLFSPQHHVSYHTV